MRLFLFLLLLLASRPLLAQKDSTTTLYFPEVGWSIEVPDKYQLMDTSLHKQIQARGVKAISEAYQQPIEAVSYKTLFAIRPSLTNYIEAVANPYNAAEEGNWEVTSQEVNEVITYTFQQKLPNTSIDTLTTQENVGGELFKKFTLSFSLPNDGGQLNMILYTALIMGHDFSVNILYVSKDVAIGQEFLTMWRKSTFNQKFTPPKIIRD